MNDPEALARAYNDGDASALAPLADELLARSDVRGAILLAHPHGCEITAAIILELIAPLYPASRWEDKQYPCMLQD